MSSLILSTESPWLLTQHLTLSLCSSPPHDSAACRTFHITNHFIISVFIFYLLLSGAGEKSQTNKSPANFTFSSWLIEKKQVACVRVCFPIVEACDREQQECLWFNFVRVFVCVLRAPLRSGWSSSRMHTETLALDRNTSSPVRVLLCYLKLVPCVATICGVLCQGTTSKKVDACMCVERSEGVNTIRSCQCVCAFGLEVELESLVPLAHVGLIWSESHIYKFCLFFYLLFCRGWGEAAGCLKVRSDLNWEWNVKAWFCVSVFLRVLKLRPIKLNIKWCKLKS